MSKTLKEYEDWKESVLDCSLCVLKETRKNVVVDAGNPAARLALVGEAPGADEDFYGEAFVGKSGRLLRAILEKATLSPKEDVVFFNVLMCRPPHNKFPNNSVVQKCQPHTRTKFDLLRPEICVLVGRQASKWVLYPKREIRMKDVLGKYFWTQRYPYVRYFTSIYHPAYLLRQKTEDKERLEQGIVEIFSQIREDLRRQNIPRKGTPVVEPQNKKAPSLFDNASATKRS